MIRVYMPDGSFKVTRGTFRVAAGFPVLRLQDGRVMRLDPIAMVFRGKKLAYGPRDSQCLRESDGEFLQENEAWGIARDGMPLVRRVVFPMSDRSVQVLEANRAAAALAAEILDRGGESDAGICGDG